MAHRLQVRENDPDTGAERTVERYEDGENFEEDMWEWLESKIPAIETGQLCEKGVHEEEGVGPAFAETFFYTYDGTHICYTYVCWECSEDAVGSHDSPDVGDIPTDGHGYVVDPQHCTT